MKKLILTFKKENILIVSLIIVTSFIQIYTSLIHVYALNELVDQSFSNFIRWYLFSFILWVVYLFTTYYLNIYKTKTIQKMLFDMRSSYTKKVEENPKMVSTSNVGESLSILTNDINTIESTGFESFYRLIATVFTTLFALSALYSIHPLIMFTSIVLTVILTVLPKYISKKNSEKMKLFSIQNEKFVNQTSLLLAGFKNLLFNGKADLLTSKMQEYNRQLIDKKIDFTKYSTRVNLQIAFLSIVAQFMIIIQTAYLNIAGLVAVGSIMSTGTIAGNVFNALSDFSSTLIEIKATSAIFEKFERIGKRIVQTETGIFESLELKNVSFNYALNNSIINGLSLIVSKGDKVIITGDSGSGKSTLMNVLNGMNTPTEGNIVYNHFNIEDADFLGLYPRINYVSNHTPIFEGTLKENLTLYSDIDEQEIQQLLQTFKLEQWIKDIHKPIKETELSTGQLQRIGLIRALLSRTELLLLDESMSNIDAETVQILHDVILVDPSLTIIYVSHHLSGKENHYFNKLIHIKPNGRYELKEKRCIQSNEGSIKFDYQLT